MIKNVCVFGVFGLLAVLVNAAPIQVSPHALIEAEDYVRYYDTTPGNSGFSHRSDDVDIEHVAPEGFNVGYVVEGEWLAWDIIVSQAGSYEFVARVASEGKFPRFAIELNGKTIGSINHRDTGYFQNWEDATTEIVLPLGEHELKIVARGSDFNLDHFIIRRPGTGENLGKSKSVYTKKTPAIVKAPTDAKSVASPTTSALSGNKYTHTDSKAPTPKRSKVAMEPRCVPQEAQLSKAVMRIAPAFPDLAPFAAPLAMVQPERDQRYWYVLLREGRVLRFDNNKRVKSVTTVLDLSKKVSTELEMGMTGMAFHPQFPDDPRVFIIYNDRTNGGRSTLSSFRVDQQDSRLQASSETPLLTLDQPGNNHNGGDLAFGKDGMLYAGFGDGGESYTGGDPNYSQVLSNLLGTVIRIDVSSEPYLIPPDNPFYTGQMRCESSASARGQTCPEIYAYGLRNPWRISVDMATGSVWVGDVGELTYEEVNRLIPGGNYGWPIMEGDGCHDGRRCSPSEYELPVSSYGREQGISVVGGYVYRGDESSDLVGQYIFGDVFSNQFFRLAADSKPGTAATPAFRSERTIYAMAQGHDGEVYLLNASPSGAGDNVFRVNGKGKRAGVPNQLKDSCPPS